MAYEKIFLNNNLPLFTTSTSMLTVGVRYNFSFAQTHFSVRKGNAGNIATQSARGSLLYDSKTNYLDVSNQNQVGRGGLVIKPFVDLNNNGKRDAGEPAAFGLNLKINGGRLERNNRDTSIRITGLEAYTDYLIELDKNSFDNIAWQLTKKNIQVNIEPDHFKLVEVAVKVVAEVSGTVYLKEGLDKRGLGRIIVNIYDENGLTVGKTITEADGYFSLMELSPGNYIAGIDPTQIRKLNFQKPLAFAFNVKPLINGNIIDDLHFILEKK